MVNIIVDEATLERLKSHARPFVDVSPDAAINRALAASSRDAYDKRDLDIINAHSDELNEEAIDVLGYQVEM